MRNMNRTIGTRWFTYYTKIRACIYAALLTVGAIRLLQHPEIFLNDWKFQSSSLLLLLLVLVELILTVLVFAKSCKGEYADFVRFVRIILFIEVVIYTIAQVASIYYKYKIGILALALAPVYAFVYYFIWFRMNKRYFEERLMNAEPISDARDPHMPPEKIESGWRKWRSER